MAEKVTLINDEIILYKDLCKLVNETQHFCRNDLQDYEEQNRRNVEMAEKAH